MDLERTLNGPLAVFGDMRRAASRRDGPASDVSSTDFTDLRKRVGGTVTTRSDEGYHDARRVWNGLIDHHPAAVARCRRVADVVEAVDFARERGLSVSVRSAGHNVAGTSVSDGGLVVDVSSMTDIDVDPAARRVRVEPGVRLGGLNRATQAYGLATPGGMAADTGVAGSTLGGGIGWLRRKYGLGIDSLLSVEMVLADGSVVRASEDSHPDLFWAVRGAGGQFGVVTSFEFALHPVGPRVARAMVYYPASVSADVLRSYRRYARTAPDEVTTLAFHSFAPRSPPVPAEARGEPALGMIGCYAGPVAEGARTLRPLREFADPLADYSDVTAFVDVHDDPETYPHGRHYWWKSLFLRDLSEACIDRLVERARAAPSRRSSVTLWQLGGAMNRVPSSATAFPVRNALFMCTVEAAWDDPAVTGENLEWARETWADLREFSTGALYVNFPGLGEEGPGLLRAAYGANYERLLELKAKYDGTNLFRSGGGLVLPPATDWETY